MNWVKSGRCDTNSCAEATVDEGTVYLRNSTDPDGPVLGFTPAGWAGFVLDVRSGDFPDPLEGEQV